MPAPCAASITSRNAWPLIIVPVGLAGLAMSTPLSRALRWLANNSSGVIAQRVASSVSSATGSQPSARMIWRYGG